MTDRELLESAARAAGLPFSWNPLHDDGDALRLAVKLGLAVFPPENDGDEAAVSMPGRDGAWVREPVQGDPYAATRRAIVRAAAAMEQSNG